MALVLVGASNAVNLTDGLDGLAIGLMLIAAGAMTVLAYLEGNADFARYLELSRPRDASELAIFSAAMTGASLGFLWFNAHPAEVFMGDVGSLALGGGLGTVAVLLKQELLLPFIAGVYVLEAFVGHPAGRQFQAAGEANFQNGPLAPPLRTIGMGRIQGDHPLLDRRAAAGVVRADDVETEMKVEGARAVVVGMARSGVAAVELLMEQGARVTAVDQSAVANPKLVELGVSVQPQEAAAFEGADLVVLSPGVPADLEVLQPVRGRGIPVIGDLELASWFLKGEIIGITGSNGKTTTTAMTGHILQASGIPVQVGGNIGTPPASMVRTSRAGQWNVLELSSFQLETISTFRAHIGAASKCYARSSGSPLYVREVRGREGSPVRKPAFGRFRGAECGRSRDARVRGTHRREIHVLQLDEQGRARCMARSRIKLLLDDEPLMAAAEVPLRGVHNLENTMAAAIIARLAGATHEQIRAAVMSFPGVEHRLEFVRDLDGVAWYNDSKATNVDATLKALAAFPGGLWVILGGKDKNSDYRPLAAAMKEKTRGVLLIGAAADKIENHLHGRKYPR